MPAEPTYPHRHPVIRWSLFALLIALVTGGAVLYAQFPGGGMGGRRGGGGGFGGGGRGGRGQMPNRGDYPQWENPKEFDRDVFMFARIQFDSFGGRGGGGEHWRNDFPDCDWNFSYRLQQLTALGADPNGKVLRLTDPDLFDYPFIYMSNVQQMMLSAEEIAGLRRYLLNGGFLLADDFWAPAAWRHVKQVMREVFPDRQTRELTLDHEIFHIVYDMKQLPQVPSILAWQRGDRFEYWHGDPEGDEAPHFHGLFDDSGRLMALLCHNNDIGDGWEREGEDKAYFEEFSEKFSYPFGINLITYVMTH
ncbi:MAG: DUF4159 domain-containing protein [Planctomycetota bacterium]|nr:DUF4159 domain-containing protein [Planctomycetota bacterium]